MPITYDLTTKKITVTGYTESTPCTFEDIYQADIAGGWGVVQKQAEKQYALNCGLVIGDGTTETWFATKKEQIIFYTQGADFNCLETKANSHFISGTLISSEKGQGKDGSDFLFIINDVTHTANRIAFYAGDVRLYNSKFEVWNKAGVYNWQTIWFIQYAIKEAFQVICSGILSYFGETTGKVKNLIVVGSNAGFEQCYFGEGSEYLWAFGTYNDVYTPPREDLGQLPLTKAYFETIRTWSAPANFIGAIKDYLGPLPFPTPSWEGTPALGCYIKWYASVKVKVIDKNNNPIANALVQVYNKDNVLQFEASTNSNGEAEGVVWCVKDEWSGSGNSNIRTDYNDFTLKITKAGYADFQTKLTIYKPKDLVITLDGLTYTYDDIKVALDDKEIFELIK